MLIRSTIFANTLLLTLALSTISIFAYATDEANSAGEASSGNDNATGIEIKPVSQGAVSTVNCPVLVGSANTPSIAGLYDVTDEDFVEDIAYLHIGNNGTITIYVQQQIGTEDAPSVCYEIFEGEASLSPLGDDMFNDTSYTDPETDCTTIITKMKFVRSDSELTLSYTDVDDEDEDGDTTDIISDSLPVLTGVSVESLQRCE